MKTDTPETDAKASDIIGFFSCATVPADFARRLERERDEAREDLKITQEAWVKAKAERADALRKRDEARKDAAHWKTEYEIVVARLCGKKHPRDNGIISEHEIIPKLTQERDEARRHLQDIKEYGTEEINAAVELRQKLAAALHERDEARSLVDHYREQKDLLPISWDV